MRYDDGVRTISQDRLRFTHPVPEDEGHSRIGRKQRVSIVVRVSGLPVELAQFDSVSLAARVLRRPRSTVQNTIKRGWRLSRWMEVHYA